tara:strand:+ start:358 stop:1365 length:1008 start_codon:yes stop_codon:yes gene_type:complete
MKIAERQPLTTIFDVQSIDRNRVRWEDYLFKQTPVEKHGGIYFKREDKFAPLGFGSINGSKLRQCIWLVDQWVKDKNIRGVVSGSVVGSPQHPFIASICKHYRIGCLIATGAKNYLSHQNMSMADELGAKFHVTNIGYAKALQSISFKLSKRLPNHEVLETNITVDEKLNPPSRIEAFHRIGAEQAKNIPDDVETIIIPCGSCNSVVSILYGIGLFKPKRLKNIVLMGIGNNGSNNLDYIPRRLNIISKVKGLDLNPLFKFDGEKGDYNIHHFNLNGSGFCQYSDLMPYNHAGIEFHPRYEGKCMNYIFKNKSLFTQFWNEKTLFWIIGNEPTWV